MGETLFLREKVWPTEFHIQPVVLSPQVSTSHQRPLVSPVGVVRDSIAFLFVQCPPLLLLNITHLQMEFITSYPHSKIVVSDILLLFELLCEVVLHRKPINGLCRLLRALHWLQKMIHILQVSYLVNKSYQKGTSPSQASLSV